MTATTSLDLRCTVFHDIEKVPKREHEFCNGMNSVTYIGHATALICLDSINIITDPMFSNCLGWYAKRYIEPGVRFDALPPIHAIVISHEHADHLDKPTLRRFSRNTPLIISKELGDEMRELGFTDVRDLACWDSTVIGAIRIIATPARHIASHSSGYIVQGSKTIYFAGDTGLFDEMTEIGRKFSIDVALLPIGDYYPRLWFIPGFIKMTRARHMAAGDVPNAIKMLRPRIVVPIHWGTFKISGTDLNEPIEWFNEIVIQYQLKRTVFLLHHGETIKL